MLFKRLKQKDHDEIAFRVLLGFLLAFIPMRGYLYFEYAGYVRKSFIIVGDVHVHHFVFGITVLAIAGYMALAAPYFRRKIAWLYGIGLALAFDEFSIWLRLDADYWTRASITAVVIIAGLLVNMIYFKRFWLRAWRTTRFVNPLYPIVRATREPFEKAKVNAMERMKDMFEEQEAREERALQQRGIK